MGGRGYRGEGGEGVLLRVRGPFGFGFGRGWEDREEGVLRQKKGGGGGGSREWSGGLE